MDCRVGYHLSYMVMIVDCVPGGTEAVCCLTIVETVGTEFSGLRLYLHKRVLTGIGNPAHTIAITGEAGKSFVTLGSSF